MRSDGDESPSGAHAQVARTPGSSPTPPPDVVGYEVAFVARTDAAGAEDLRRRLELVGHPVLHTEDAGVVRVRVRCRHAGRAVAAIIAWGAVEDLRVEAPAAW